MELTSIHSLELEHEYITIWTVKMPDGAIVKQDSGLPGEFIIGNRKADCTAIDNVNCTCFSIC